MNPMTRPLRAVAANGPRRASARSRINIFARCLALLTLAACSLASAAPARAVEMQVEGLQDILAQPPAPLSNHCTLRKAINNANDNAGTYPQCQNGEGGGIVDTIVFNLPGTVTFALAGTNEDDGETGDLDITDSLTIIGHPDGTIIDAADLDRVFHINPGNMHPGIVVTLRNITIRNGRGPGGAGGILLEGNATLILENCTISDNLAFMGDGGGIGVTSGGSGSPTLNMTNTTLSGNVADFHAGAMVVEAGTVNITNSTITHNSSATGLSGGLRNTATVNVRSSIIAANTNQSMVNYIPNLDGIYTSQGYNVIGNLGVAPGTPVFVPQPTDQVGVTDAQLNIGPLANNGGPTPTHALLAGSVAIDKGHSTGATADQRGQTRPCDLASVSNAAGGDGSDSGSYELQGACLGSNQPPDAVDDAASVAEDSGPNVLNVLANDTDPDADSPTVVAVTQGSHGSVSNNSSSVSYSPASNYFGPDSFTYTIDDGHGSTDTATVSVNVTPVEDTPDAVDDAANVLEDSGANVVNVLSNDTDPDGDALSVAAVTQGAHGAVSNNGTSVSYSPAPNYFGPDSFTYTVSDGHGGLDTAAVSVSVQNVNDAPVAAGDAYDTNSNTPLHVGAPGVLSNDSDVDGDALVAQQVSGPSHALSFALHANGSFDYTPAADFAGGDSFKYRASDGSLPSNTVTVNITVHDTVPPVLNASVGTGSLWPPNHDLVNVGLSATASDNSGDPVQIQVAVFSDEDDITSGGGEMSPDARNIAPGTLRLRAEREGSDDGRVYLIVVTATDSSNNVTRKCLAVVIPKSQGKGADASVAQQAQAAVAYCQTHGGAPPPGYFVVGDGPTVGPKQ